MVMTMHELSLAQSVLDIVRQYVPPDDHVSVRAVRMKVGELSGVVSESLAFCFEAITSGTPLGGARLEIEQVPLRCRCRTCRAESRIQENRFRCSACGSGEIDIIAGRELQVLDIEVDDGG